mmetsp:Transcript_14729/g.27978  ORF Transcript_14729/g.27978 Transcript_14729/m.27978 type:complete len:201 (+) Transcript_14729:879-1481(+)
MAITFGDRSLRRVKEFLHLRVVLRNKLVVKVEDRGRANNVTSSNFRHRACLSSRCIADTNADGASILDDNVLHRGVTKDFTPHLAKHCRRPDRDLLSGSHRVGGTFHVVCHGDSLCHVGGHARLNCVVPDGMIQHPLHSSKHGVSLRSSRGLRAVFQQVFDRISLVKDGILYIVNRIRCQLAKLSNPLAKHEMKKRGENA